MKNIYFNNRQGQTVLSKKEQEGLILSHITNINELNEAEQMNINEGLIWLAQQKGTYLNDSFFRRLHKRLFGKVWKWAGLYRTTEKNIGVDYWKVPSEIKKLCDDTKYWIENSTYPWPELTAHFHHRLVYIHPFPNGNGRFSRILTNHLCTQNGHKPPSWYADLTPEKRRETYIGALRRADIKDYSPLIKFMSKTI